MTTNAGGRAALALVQKFFPHVLKVRDARRNVRLAVIERDIAPGGRKKQTSCAFAQACKRQLHMDGAVVSVSRAYLVKRSLAVRYEIPASVSREITAFDRGGSISPGIYELKQPTKSNRLGVKWHNKTGPKNTTRRGLRHITDDIRVFA
jgi:hypothetical protein